MDSFKFNKKLQTLHLKYNKKYFDGLLPKLKVCTADLLSFTDKGPDGQYGLALTDENGDNFIIIDEGLCKYHSDFAKTVLLHEEIHFYIGLHLGHGKSFKTQIRRIASLGALDNLV